MPTYTYDETANNNDGEIKGTPTWVAGYPFPGPLPKTYDETANSNTGSIYGTPTWVGGYPFEEPAIALLFVTGTRY